VPYMEHSLHGTENICIFHENFEFKYDMVWYKAHTIQCLHLNCIIQFASLFKNILNITELNIFFSPLVTFHNKSIFHISHLSYIHYHGMALAKDCMANWRAPKTVLLTSELQWAIKGQWFKVHGLSLCPWVHRSMHWDIMAQSYYIVITLHSFTIITCFEQ
jgi:hypothetical protein